MPGAVLTGQHLSHLIRSCRLFPGQLHYFRPQQQRDNPRPPVLRAPVSRALPFRAPSRGAAWLSGARPNGSGLSTPHGWAAPGAALRTFRSSLWPSFKLLFAFLPLSFQGSSAIPISDICQTCGWQTRPPSGDLCLQPHPVSAKERGVHLGTFPRPFLSSVDGARGARGRIPARRRLSPSLPPNSSPRPHRACAVRRGSPCSRVTLRSRCAFCQWVPRVSGPLC